VSGIGGKAEARDLRLKRRSCEGFRMTAHRDDAACTGAGVRKPPGKETAVRDTGVGARYGDLSARACGIYEA
jgi:hypothetical protein